MATKTISIDVEAYERLRKVRRENESFSQTLKRVLPREFNFDKWLKEIRVNPVSEQFAEAVEQVIANRRSPSNLGSRDAVLGHNGADRPAKSPRRGRKGGGGAAAAGSGG